MTQLWVSVKVIQMNTIETTQQREGEQEQEEDLLNLDDLDIDSDCEEVEYDSEEDYQMPEVDEFQQEI